jgi:hypothetical protein
MERVQWLVTRNCELVVIEVENGRSKCLLIEESVMPVLLY